MSQNYTWPAASITATNPSVGVNGATSPTSATLVAGQTSGNLQPLQTDGSGNLKAVLVAGSAIVGTVKIDQTTPGTTNGVVVNSSALPTGAATETTLAAASAKLPATLGQKAMTASLAVVIASDQSAIPVSAASLPLPSGAATETTLAAMSAKLPATLGTHVTSASMAVNIASDQTVAVSAASLPLPTGAATSANQTTISGQLPSSLGAKVTAGSLAVNIASDQTVPTSIAAASTSAVTSVASSASSVSLLASNASRKGATFFNDSTALVYLKLGATASSTSYTVQIPAGGYYELPFIRTYSGAIDGIWASANGNMRITELT